MVKIFLCIFFCATITSGNILPPQKCTYEIEAAKVLGYTQVSWDNKSGKEKQPASAKKDWDRLTDKERLAATALGYNGKMWDKEKKVPPAMKKDWADLTTSCGDGARPQVCKAEKEAAKLLGYTRFSSDIARDSKPEQAAAKLLGYTQVSWDNKSGKEKQPDSMDKNWEDLTYDEKLGASVLGYTRKMWNKDKKVPPAMEKDWADLTSSCDRGVSPQDCNTELDAAKILGYTQVSWDNKSGKEEQPASWKKAWYQLTHQERLAANVLGYNGKMWDKGKKLPLAIEKYFADLTSTCDRDVPPQECNTEQDAAKVLGYTQASWDNKSGKEKQPGSMDKTWDDLADMQRKAATALGYTRKMWNKGKRLPPAMKKDWADLTSTCGWDVPPQDCNTEQDAARILGYTRTSWNNKSGKEKQPDSMDKYWDELTDAEKQAAGVLGYRRNMWDRDTKLPPAMKKRWGLLTSTCNDIDHLDLHPRECIAEQEAATILGYTQLSWDNLSGRELQPSSTDKDWDELTDLERDAAAALGYTRHMWDKGKKLPPAMMKDWTDLTFSCANAGLAVLPEDCNTELDAAKVLGYTQASWDNASGNEQQPVSAEKDWDELAYKEKLAAVVLGYTRKMWDKGKKQPPAADKHWAELSTCATAVFKPQSRKQLQRSINACLA